MMNRRSFSKSILGAVGIASIMKSCINSQEQNKNELDDLTFLFHGDSITDAGRIYMSKMANGSLGLGTGYVNYIAMELLGKRNQVKIFNKAFKGNKTIDLLKNWDKECIKLEPNVVTILVGVNDFRTTLLNNPNTKKEKFLSQFESNYRSLIEKSLEKMQNIKLILIEPFYVKGGNEVHSPSWTSDYRKFQKITKDLSDEYETGFIPLQKIFDESSLVVPPKSLSIDGIHPTLAGHYLIAQSWLNFLNNS